MESQGPKELHGDEVDGIGPMPEQPIDRLLRPLANFLHVEATSGVVLVLCTAIALFAANSSFAESYLAFWNTKITIGFGAFEFRHSLHHVINDGLMAVFFFVIGLEVKREIVHGSLSDWRQASLPIAAALGGMLVPAGLYLAVQYGQPGMRGWGIVLFSWVAIRLGWARMPPGVQWPILFAGGCLAGIGFTMALFIDGLAFGIDGFDIAKAGVLFGSATSAILGMSLLTWLLPRTESATQGADLGDFQHVASGKGQPIEPD